MAIALQSKRGADINVTPLIDVLLVLLIVFMVISPTRPVGLGAAVPSQPDTPKATQPDTAIVVHIDRQMTVRINQELSSFDELGSRLAAIFANRAEKIAFIDGDPSLDFRYVAHAIDITRGAGIERVGLMPKR
ncbi:MAG: biopolymer transporter ExbD [Bryobacteraceae bacterium]|nr:biopolymer transporter ExbD [Bryobacteraceae bacterium]